MVIVAEQKDFKQILGNIGKSVNLVAARCACMCSCANCGRCGCSCLCQSGKCNCPRHHEDNTSMSNSEILLDFFEA